MKRIVNLACAILAMLMLVMSAMAQNTSSADLHGTVKDPSGAAVPNATITVRDDSRNIERTVQSNGQGEYLFALLPPGNYTMTVQGAGFAKLTAKDVRLTIGQSAELPIGLKLASSSTDVTVSAAGELVETSRTAVSNTIDQQRIENLPINERSYLSFALTSSTVDRDHGRTIGPAPTSGLNIGGQRGRSTLVQVDGADNTDTSINAARSTLSQEAVQEFQVVTNSYAAEYGRASGGVVNVVSKGGSNDLHGDVFGFLRHKSFQAQNAFAPVPDAPFTRTQYGMTLGGPIVKDKTFFFGSFEQRRRQESGFFTSNVSKGLTGSASIPAIPGLNPAALTFTNITPQQAGFINTLVGLGGANICAARAYGFFAANGGDVGLNGTTGLRSPNDGSVCPAISPILPGTVGPRFLLSGAPVPSGTTNAAGLPIAFRPLSQLQKIFPVSEGTTFSSLRGDHRFNDRHALTTRVGFNTNLSNGLQVESQNQSLGQNDVSRTGVQQFRDWSALGGLTSTFTSHLINEANFNYGRRSAAFSSQNGDAVADNIAGTAFLGRELFSPVHRVESRYQFRDSVSWITGHHSMKFGGDFNWINVDATFELNFAGLFNFGATSASSLLGAAFVNAPDFTPVQSYGLGFPSTYIQGFGNPASSLGNKPMSVFWQDAWQIKKNIVINYGVRYDFELTQQIAPVGFTDPLTGTVLSAANILAAQDAMNVQQGFPRDKNNFAPRLAIAWDPWSDGKTVFRGAYGLFYDHPLAAVAFNSDIADAAQQQQLVSVGGSPAQNQLLNAVQIFQGTVCVPGRAPTAICPAGVVTPGVAASANYQFGRQRFDPQTFPGFGTVLPFTLPVTKDFQFAYANQGSVSFEHQFSDDFSLSVGGLWVGTRHLPRPIDINAPDNSLLLANYKRFSNNVNPINGTQAYLIGAFPTTATGCNGGPCIPGSSFTSGGQTFVNIVPGFIVQGPNGKVIAPAAANFFRPNAPNYFLFQALTGLNQTAVNGLLAGTLRTPGVLSPFGSVDAQTSTGTSDYTALNVDFKKRFSRNFQFLASYTWGHSIDDSSDLQTLLLPQDNRNVASERSDSLFDQRHRFVFTSVVTSPVAWRGSSNTFTKILADFTVAPVVEFSSGRPFNILTNADTNNDQSSQTDRPNVGANGLLKPPDFDPTCACFPAGNLVRNAGITTPYSAVDLRISRLFHVTERMNLVVISEGFNLLNRNNEAAASPFFTDVNSFNEKAGNKYHSIPTASFDPRQFQFALKLTW
ncbi:MAG: hypothetical protein JWO20_1126 [Candidatus Angelobacter sp.]|jgi:hypothetical protein|nr:hypothetical protein [Candidatus Angelobacter sp.]